MPQNTCLLIIHLLLKTQFVWIMRYENSLLCPGGMVSVWQNAFSIKIIFNLIEKNYSPRIADTFLANLKKS